MQIILTKTIKEYLWEWEWLKTFSSFGERCRGEKNTPID